jgi:hypothetical protein
MNDESEKINQQIEMIREKIWNFAQELKEDPWLLLSLLRDLEATHRQIREELFEPSLPDTRQNLYKFLKEIDEMGGWPYIERMKLQSFCTKLQQAEESKKNQSPESE